MRTVKRRQRVFFLGEWRNTFFAGCRHQRELSDANQE